MLTNISVLAVLALATSACSGQGSDEASSVGVDAGLCTIPDGTYQMAISPLAGDCPTTLVNELQFIFDDANQSHVIAGGECGPVNGSALAESITHQCILTLSFAGDGGLDGVENGSGTLSAICNSSPDCTQDLAIAFERLE